MFDIALLSNRSKCMRYPFLRAVEIIILLFLGLFCQVLWQNFSNKFEEYSAFV